MLSIIKENLLRKDLISPSNPILCAISGGIDSMVMLDCLVNLNINVAVVHVDHNTRNGQSKKDMEFVQSKCRAYNIH
jgi:tRNA(Ile)-lysidine synthase TilS/MesJ